MQADVLVRWLVDSSQPQREKLATVRERYVAAIRDYDDDDHRRVVRELKKRLSSPKLAGELAALLGDVTRDRPARPRAEAAPAEPAPLASEGGDRRSELEAAIARDPDAQQPYLPYGDWLESQGDPFGALIAIDRELAKNPGHKAMLAAREQYFVEHGAALLGPLREVEDMLRDVTWHMGFIRSCRILQSTKRRSGKLPQEPIANVLAALLDEPGPGRFVQELELGHDLARDLPWPTVALAAKPRPALRNLDLGAARSGDFAALWPALPGLRALRLFGDRLTPEQLAAAGAALPALERLVVAGSVEREHLTAMTQLRWPALRALELELGTESGRLPDAADLATLVDGTALPALRELTLSGCPEGDELLEALAASPLLRQLERLDLSRGTVGERGARALLAEPGALASLSLVLDENFVPRELADALGAALRELSVEGQRDDGGDPSRRYAMTVE